MSGKLKIYACSGIGEAQDPAQSWNYWTDNTSTLSNTQAVNTLLALINRNYIEVTRLRGMTEADKIANLNDIDVYVVCMKAAQRFADDPEQLRHAGRVIGSMMKAGDFNCDSLDNTVRDEHLDELLDRANAMYDQNGALQTDKAFVEWFEQTVVKRNKVGLSASEQQRMEKALQTVSGIGAANNSWKDADFAKYLLDAGEYFLYTYFTDAQLKQLPKVFTNKKKKQMQTYNYCKAGFVDVYGSENEMREIIRSGIIDRFTVQPEDVCKDIVEGKRSVSGVGQLATEVIVALIGAAVTIVTTLITAICQAIAKKNEAKYGSLDQQIIESSVPNEDDFDGLSKPSTQTAGSGKSWLTLGLIAAGAFLILKK